MTVREELTVEQLHRRLDRQAHTIHEYARVIGEQNVVIRKLRKQLAKSLPVT